MPTIQCANCGAQYYSAATDQLLDLVVALFDCEMCAERGPLHVLDDGVGYLAGGTRSEPGLSEEVRSSGARHA